MKSIPNAHCCFDDVYDVLFHLLAVGLNQIELDVSRIDGLQQQDWERLFTLSSFHEVAALVSETLLANEEINIPIDVRLKFIGLQDIAEQSYNHQLNVLDDLLELFDSYDIPTMIIKGFSLAQYYPAPSHRKCGDIDIYQFGHQSQSDQLISQKYGLEIRNNIVGHHTNYQYREVSIENHYQFITTYFGRQSFEIESLMEIEADNSVQAKLGHYKILFPSPNLNAFFLPYHMSVHFRPDKVTFRQIIDWMMFLESEYDKVDWQKLQNYYKTYHLVDFVNAINGILIHYLGMPVKYASNYFRNELLEKRILYDMLKSSQDNQIDGVISNIKHKWDKYIRHGWKFHIFGRSAILELFKKVLAVLKHDNEEYVLFKSSSAKIELL